MNQEQETELDLSYRWNCTLIKSTIIESTINKIESTINKINELYNLKQQELIYESIPTLPIDLVRIIQDYSKSE